MTFGKDPRYPIDSNRISLTLPPVQETNTQKNNLQLSLRFSHLLRTLE